MRRGRQNQERVSSNRDNAERDKGRQDRSEPTTGQYRAEQEDQDTQGEGNTGLNSRIEDLSAAVRAGRLIYPSTKIRAEAAVKTPAECRKQNGDNEPALHPLHWAILVTPSTGHAAGSHIGRETHIPRPAQNHTPSYNHPLPPRGTVSFGRAGKWQALPVSAVLCLSSLRSSNPHCGEGDITGGTAAPAGLPALVSTRQKGSACITAAPASRVGPVRADTAGASRPASHRVLPG